MVLKNVLWHQASDRKNAVPEVRLKPSRQIHTPILECEEPLSGFCSLLVPKQVESLQMNVVGIYAASCAECPELLMAIVFVSDNAWGATVFWRCRRFL